MLEELRRRVWAANRELPRRGLVTPWRYPGYCVPAKAVENAVILEEVARMAILTRQIDPDAAPAPRYLQDKHYHRKHGPGAYYGQL